MDKTVVHKQIQLETNEQYFHVFTMRYKMVLIVKSVDKTLICDHLTQRHWAVA